jgi:hypothetical protein
VLSVEFDDGRFAIVQRVSKACAAYGEVRSVRIFIESVCTAVVEMSTMEQTEKLASGLGGRLVGSTAFIELMSRSGGAR